MMRVPVVLHLMVLAFFVKEGFGQIGSCMDSTECPGGLNADVCDTVAQKCLCNDNYELNGDSTACEQTMCPVGNCKGSNSACDGGDKCICAVNFMLTDGVCGAIDCPGDPSPCTDPFSYCDGTNCQCAAISTGTNEQSCTQKTCDPDDLTGSCGSNTACDVSDMNKCICAVHYEISSPDGTCMPKVCSDPTPVCPTDSYCDVDTCRCQITYTGTNSASCAPIMCAVADPPAICDGDNTACNGGNCECAVNYMIINAAGSSTCERKSCSGNAALCTDSDSNSHCDNNNECQCKITYTGTAVSSCVKIQCDAAADPSACDGTNTACNGGDCDCAVNYEITTTGGTSTCTKKSCAGNAALCTDSNSYCHGDTDCRCKITFNGQNRATCEPTACTTNPATECGEHTVCTVSECACAPDYAVLDDECVQTCVNDDDCSGTADSYCDVTSDIKTCVCKITFVNSGGSCVPKQCVGDSPATCGANTACNTAGNCVCQANYEVNQDVCRQIDCTSNSELCTDANSFCVDSSKTCECKQTYDGTEHENCELKDCNNDAPTNCLANTACNTNGKCACAANYQLTAEACTVIPCGTDSALCADDNAYCNGGECACKITYHGTEVEDCAQTECGAAANPMTCTGSNTVCSSDKCVCIANYEIADGQCMEKTCSDSTVCSAADPNSYCASGNCACKVNYDGADKAVCTQIPCNSGNLGSVCATNSKCDESACACADNYVALDSECGLQCMTDEDCTPNDANSYCDTSSGSCACKITYEKSGQSCVQKICQSNSPASCGTDTACDAEGKCVCQATYEATGDACVQIDCSSSSAVCSSTDANSYCDGSKCLCKTNFDGTTKATCEQKTCTNSTECAAENSFCKTTSDPAVCTCGFLATADATTGACLGTACSAANNSAVCGTASSCAPSGGVYRCACGVNYIPQDTECVQQQCSTNDDCGTYSECNNAGQCVCKSPLMADGTSCKTACTNENECTAVGASCSDGTCDCPANQEGDGATCTPITCTVDDATACLPNSECNSGTCACATGWEVVDTVCKKTCSDSDDCGDNAACVDSKCECSSGYAGDGVQCDRSSSSKTAVANLFPTLLFASVVYYFAYICQS